MGEHFHRVRFAALGLGFAMLGVVLVIQELAGPLALRWGVVLPGLVIAIGVLVVATALIGGRRSGRPTT